jgi:hypothetical protein
MFAQYDCPNFHAKRDGGPKLSLAIKNKWSTGWKKSWFYWHVPCLCNSEGGKRMYALYSRMGALDYVVEPKVECPDDDPNNAAFVCTTATIEGWDAVEEFVVCKMYPLASGFGFRGMTVSTTPVSKVQTPLSVFPVGAVSMEGASRILAKEERILGSFKPKEYDVLSAVKLPNGGLLNHVFEQMGLAYAPRPLPGVEAFRAAKEKRKTEVSKKSIAKKAKTAVSRAASSKTMPPRKIGIVKVVRPRVKPEPQGTSEIELALAGVSKFFCLLDVSSSSHCRHAGGAAVAKADERAARVAAFDNIGDDSSLDVRKATLPQESEERLPPTPLLPD